VGGFIESTVAPDATIITDDSGGYGSSPFGFYPFNAFRSLLSIAGDDTAPTYADLYAEKSRTTTLGSQ
jgi:hypothetical protein